METGQEAGFIENRQPLQGKMTSIETYVLQPVFWLTSFVSHTRLRILRLHLGHFRLQATQKGRLAVLGRRRQIDGVLPLAHAVVEADRPNHRLPPTVLAHQCAVPSKLSATVVGGVSILGSW